jgi:AcrR family transcriptional regulator
MIKDAVSQKILDATITCIGRVGVQALTNRMVAEEAGVNHAAINYYFGSKEVMVQEAIRGSLESYLSEFLDDNSRTGSSKELPVILEDFLNSILRDSLSTPFFIKSYLYEPIINNNYNGIFVERINSFIEYLSERPDAWRLGDTPEKIKLALMQITSSIMFICLVPNFYNRFLTTDMNVEVSRQKIVKTILSHYLDSTYQEQAG